MWRVIVLFLGMLLAVWPADSPAADALEVTGVRGKAMQLYATKNGAVVKELSRRDGLGLKVRPLPVLKEDGEWL